MPTSRSPGRDRALAFVKVHWRWLLSGFGLIGGIGNLTDSTEQTGDRIGSFVVGMLFFAVFGFLQVQVWRGTPVLAELWAKMPHESGPPPVPTDIWGHARADCKDLVGRFAAVARQTKSPVVRPVLTDLNGLVRERFETVEHLVSLGRSAQPHQVTAPVQGTPESDVFARILRIRQNLSDALATAVQVNLTVLSGERSQVELEEQLAMLASQARVLSDA